MAEVKGVYRSNGAYTYADLSNKAWGLRAASISEYRSGSGSTIIEVPDIENLTKNTWDLSGISDSQVQNYFSGDPLKTLNFYQDEALKNYWTNQNPDQQQFLVSQGGNVWDTFANQEQSDLLQQDTNYGSLLPEVNAPVTSNANERAAGSGTNLGVTGQATLKYPIDMDLNTQDHMVITVAEYVPAGRLPSIFGSTDQGQFVRTFNNKLLETIIIPMPNAIADQNNVSWGPSEMGAVAGTLFDPTSRRILGTQTSEGGDKKGIMGLLEGTGDYLKELGSAAVNLASSQYIRRRLLLNATAAAASRVGVNVDVGAVISRTAGVIDNPNIELLFNGPGLRTFDFTVRLTPRSADESKMVRQIIRVLKQRMAVKKNVRRFTASGNLLLGTPNVFRLEYRKGSRNRSEIKGLNKFKTCAMTNFRVDYSGGSGRWAAYGPDSQPVTTIITMSFSEIVPIYENDYSEFPAGDDVGF